MAKIHIRGGSKLRFEFEDPVLLTAQAPDGAGKSKKWVSEFDTFVSPNSQAYVRVAEAKNKEITIDFKPKA